MKNFTLLVLLGLLVNSCITPKPVVTKRYKSMKNVAGFVKNPEAYVTVVGNVYDVDPALAAKDATNLSDNGQKSLIEGLNRNIKESKEIFELLGNKINPQPSNESVIDKSKIKKRIVLAVYNIPYNETGNRLSKLSVDLNIPYKDTTAIKFISWDKTATEYKEIDAGKVTFTSKNGVNISPEIALAGTIEGKLPAAFTNEKTLGEEANLKARIIPLTGSINSRSAKIMQEAAPLQPIGGNIIFEVTLSILNKIETEFYKFENLYTGATPNNSNKVKVKKILLIHPNLKKPIKIEMNYSFSYRKITSGANTITESDDDVEVINGELEKSSNFVLISDEELKLNTWTISSTSISNLLVKSSSSKVPNSIVFNNYNDAEVFLAWLKRTKSIKISDQLLIANFDANSNKTIPLKAAQIEDLQVVFKKR